ncbi:MAG: hypothetical protein FWK04_04305 [Nostoc sp. GBBB01]|nr:hypothetical protein [Nostoc sp. GBBB01]
MNSEDAFLTINEAIEIIEAALKPESLSNVQEDMFSKIWEGRTYEQIAEDLDYQPEYIKYVGFQLWRSLTNAFGEKVTKSNFRAVLRRYKQNVKIPEEDTRKTNLKSSNLQIPKHTNLSEFMDVSVFFGRVDELDVLSQWIVQDGCRLVALLGMGGIGKTSLAAKLAEQIQGEFEYLIWRSLRHAPPLLTALTDINEFIESEPETEIPATIDAQLSHLLHALRTHRCLLILDDWETILRDADIAGYYRQGYEYYGEFLKRVGQERHQSSLLLLSREKPIEIATLAGESLPVRVLQIKGLKSTYAKQLLVTKGFAGTENGLDELIQLYRGHPAALKIIATTIKDLFNGNVSEFMGQSSLIIGDIFANLLDQHFERLSNLEKAIMYWLAIARQPLSLAQLKANLGIGVSSSELLAVLESLGRRTLIEKEIASFDSTILFSLQPVVMKYVTSIFIEEIFQEIHEAIATNSVEKLRLLKSHALVQQESDKIQAEQVRLILTRIKERLYLVMGTKVMEVHLQNLLAQVRENISPVMGYAEHNLLLLLE